MNVRSRSRGFRRFPDALKIACMLAAAAIATIGCGDDKPTTPGGSNGQHSSHFHPVAIRNFAFSPSPVTIAVGDTVFWTNNDSVAHTVTSETGGAFDSGSLGAGATYQHIFPAGGTFAYLCTLHPQMRGSVTVQ